MIRKAGADQTAQIGCYGINRFLRLGSVKTGVLSCLCIGQTVCVLTRPEIQTFFLLLASELKCLPKADKSSL